jgi:D-sedoheptulose 7-phosphate isomerase
MNEENVIETRFNNSIECLQNFSKNSVLSLIEAKRLILASLGNNGKVLICGNGGSAADSQHLAAEFVSAFSRDLIRPGMPAIALTVDTSIITAFSNDFGFANVFARQIQALGNASDVLIVFTTSGNSENCVRAVEQAKAIGMSTIAFTRSNAEISKGVTLSIEVPSTNTQNIQESHIVAYHILIELIENSLYRRL